MRVPYFAVVYKVRAHEGSEPWRGWRLKLWWVEVGSGWTNGPIGKRPERWRRTSWLKDDYPYCNDECHR